MSLEGLDAILTKDEIVATQRPADLLDRPKMVESAYHEHVRSYIPLGRQAEEDGGQNVNSFEKRVIRDVKGAAALRGYITAEYGYGKTSTALYLWKRAREANIVAVPPFQMTRLPDLMTATYGWLKYELERTRPGSEFVREASELYTTIIERSAETLARQYNIDRSGVQQLIKDRPDLLNLNTADYLRFFEEATRIARQAGFEGVLILADEVQQYIDPEIKTDVKDPISPLFDVISVLLTRRDHLHLGLILVLPPTVLDVLRDQRGDFIHRTLQASLDLRTIYDRAFPARLWQRLAEQFDFLDHAHRIVASNTLEALGQIGVRTDLSDGPRTVINTFRRMTRRYREAGHPVDDPYTPYHLIEDFLTGQIIFDSAKKIQRVTNQALGHKLVKGYPDRERAIKWAAAFPEEGIPRRLQETLNLLGAFDALMQSAQGDLLISVGDIKNRGITLRGLDQVEVDIGWLPTTIREFWRLYEENSNQTRQRAIRAFFELLTVKVFPDNQWKVIENIQAGLTRNDGMILEGSFNSYSRKYPERRIHIRLLWEDEAIKEEGASIAELLIQFRLRRYLDRTEEERRHHSTPLEIKYESRQINLTLNLMYRGEIDISPTLDKAVSPIVSPYKLTPLLMLALYEVINEKRANNAIPKSDDQTIRYAFQPDLIDNIFYLLFNSEVGKPVNSGQERILEDASRALLDSMYPDYETVMVVSNWSSSLSKYKNALKRLEMTHERQGQVAVEGTKEEIADFFALRTTALDSFISNYPSLLVIQQPFPTKREIEQGKKGSVRFQLHNLEKKIKKWLEKSSHTQERKIGNQLHKVRSMPTNEIYRQAQVLGYHEREIEEILDLMVDRGLIVLDRRGTITEEINLAPSIDELVALVEAWQRDLKTLMEVFVQNQLRNWAEEAKKFLDLVEQLRKKPDDEKAILARRTVHRHRSQLDDFVRDRHQDQIKTVEQFIRTIPQPNPQHGKDLNNAVSGGVSYVQQVNDLRGRLLKKFNTLTNEVDSYRQQVKTLAASLRSQDLSLSALVKLTKDFYDLQKQRDPLQKRCDDLAKDYELFSAWGRLVGGGSQLVDEIQQLGEAVRTERDRFHQLSQEIMGHLSAYKTDALPDAPTYENLLREIEENVRTTKREASARFTDLQERYQTILINVLETPKDRLWNPYPYNPADPKDSYRRLYLEVQSVLKRLHEQLTSLLQQLQEEVRSVLQNPILRTMEEREKIEVKGKTLLKNFEQTKAQLIDIEPQLTDTSVIIDFPQTEQGSFHHLLAKFQPVIQTLTGDTRKEVAQLDKDIRNFALEKEEELVLDVLPEGGQIEMSDLRQKVSLSEEELWQAVRGLHTKRRIRLPIERIRYD